MQRYEILRPMAGVKVGDTVPESIFEEGGELEKAGGIVRLLELQSIRPAVDKPADADAVSEPPAPASTRKRS